MSKEVVIDKLVFPDNIRTRQGMYGSDGETADILFREIVDNDVDLLMKNRISLNIDSYTNQEGYHIVIDDGPGLPMYKDEDYKDLDQTITIDLLTRINVGSNFHKTQYSAGMNGVGSKLTNALSNIFVVMINATKKSIGTLIPSHQQAIKDGKTVYVLQFEKGILTKELMISVDEMKSFSGQPLINNIIESKVSSNFGTIVYFTPDETLLTSIEAKYHGYPFKLINGLFPYDKDFKDVSVKFSLNDKEVESYDFKGIFHNDALIDDKILTDCVTVPTKDSLPVKFIYQVAWSSDKFNVDSDGSVNLLKTPQGRHITIVQSAITRAFNKYNGLISSNDSRLGMRLFVLSLAIEPLFNSQDKTKLSKYEDKGFNEADCTSIIADSFLKMMKANSEFFDLICARIIEYKKSMNKLNNMDLLKSSIVFGDEGDKRRAMSGEMARVYEATSRDYSRRELYITEGQSASGKIIEHRNKDLQSVLPLKGKLINTSGFEVDDLVANNEILAIINTIGCGMGAITDVARSRYIKVIISTDADSDGSHIANLITALFFHHAPALIKAGMVYKLETPYYRHDVGNTSNYYYYDEKDKIDFNKGRVIKLKGLGSHNDFSTKKYIMDPASRRLTQLVFDDTNTVEVAEASKLLYSGSARKQLMINAGYLVE